MKILFLIFSFHVGGIEKQLIEMANQMATLGNEVHLCVVNDSYDEELFSELLPLVHLFRMERPTGGGHLSYMRKLATYVRSEHIEVIHAQEPTGVVLSLLAKLICPKIRIVETVHDIGEAKEYSRMQLALCNRLTKHYIAISHSVEKEILSRGVSSKRVSVIFNAINTKKFAFCERAEKTITKDSPIELGNVARFYPEKKGQDTFIHAVEIVKETYPNVHVTLVGAVYRGQQEAYERAVSYVETHELTNQVSFAGNVDNIPAFLQSLDIFVLPSNFEGFGIALIEAMATGLPCVASDLDGPKEIFENANRWKELNANRWDNGNEFSGCGELSKAGDARSLANSIMTCLQRFDTFNRQAISSYVQDTYGIEHMVEEHLQLYRSL